MFFFNSKLCLKVSVKVSVSSIGAIGEPWSHNLKLTLDMLELGNNKKKGVFKGILKILQENLWYTCMKKSLWNSDVDNKVLFFPHKILIFVKLKT